MSRPYATEILKPPSEMELDLEAFAGLAMKVERLRLYLEETGKGQRAYTRTRIELGQKRKQFLTKWKVP